MGDRNWRFRRGILIFAWALFVGSLAMPALEQTLVLIMFLIPLPFTPVAVLIIIAFLGVVKAPLSPYTWLWIAAPFAFIASPWLIGAKHRGPGIIRRALAGCLLIPWALPITCVFFLTAQQREQMACTDILWGYYVFAGANTLAFLAVQIGPWPSRVDRRRGFTVVTEDKEGKID